MQARRGFSEINCTLYTDKLFFKMKEKLSGWDGSLGVNGYRYMHSWVTLLCTWNYHNIFNWLYSNIREGNGTPLQYSCLENPMDGGAWWAAVHEVAKSRTRLHFHISLSCIGEGNGNPLQCSCLENPRDGGAWWAAVYGVTQSRTRLKWLS